MTRRYSTLLDATRRYSTLLDATRRYSTLLDATRRYSTLLDATRRYNGKILHTLQLHSLHIKCFAGEKDSGPGLFRTLEDFEFRAGFLDLLTVAKKSILSSLLCPYYTIAEQCSSSLVKQVHVVKSE
jgi:hypothetical protein